MAHAHARLTEFGRLLLVQRITELGWPPVQAAESLGCRGPRPPSGWLATASRATPAWPTDPRGRTAAPTPSRPPRSVGCWPPADGAARPLPARLPARHGPLSGLGGLRRHGRNRLAHTDRASGVVGCYQRQRPGELVHLDVKKLGRIPDGGGHRAHGRATAKRGRGIGDDYLHSAVDDRSRVAFSQILNDEAGQTWARFLVEAASFFAEHGVRSSGC